MRTILKWLIRSIFWVQAFAAPVILCGLIALLIGPTIFFIPLLIIGAVLGIVLAEYICRKFGLENFFGRIYGPNAMDKKLQKKD